jgi:outer membrane protein OmpA-like peptidoglycan-associated protein
VNAQNKAELRPVTVGEWKGEGWLISEGLANGDKVVVDGGVRLSAGADVKAAAYTPPATATAAKTMAPPAYPAATPSGVHVLFDKGKSTLNPDAQRAIRVGAAAYIGIGTQVVITGYADKSGNSAANTELAKKRAQTVRDELVALGVEPRRIVLAAPADVTGSGSDEQARRVDVTMKQ